MARQVVEHVTAAPAPDMGDIGDNGYSYGSFPVNNAAVSSPGSSSQPEPSSSPSSSSTSSSSPSPSPLPPAAAKPRIRLLVPDLLRGLLMALMALDHLGAGLHTWQHGTIRQEEQDGLVVKRWNSTAAYIVRTLTHICEPGLALLLGMSVVLLSRSRAGLGWSPWRLLRYYAARALALIVVSVLIGLVGTRGQIWFLNMVLFALGVNYFLAGMLWLLMDMTEKMLAQFLAARKGRFAAGNHAAASNSGDEHEQAGEEAGVSRPLLPRRRRATQEDNGTHLASSLSWHVHNAILLALAVVTIYWNIWLSEHHGRCVAEASSGAAAAAPGQSAFLRIWFWTVRTRRILSSSPPMAWLSFVVLGLLYGRILTARKWTNQAVVAGHAFAAVVFAVVFVLTRVLRFGNLSEDCLRTPDQDRSPRRNQYLASPASFFYVVKYSPDVAFWAYSMACNLLLLAVFSAIPRRIAMRCTLLLDFGTSALFYYVAHSAIVWSPLMLPLKAWFGHDTGIPDPQNPGSTKGVTNVWAFFAAWLALILVLWPACRYYSRFKSTKHVDSLWRFF